MKQRTLLRVIAAALVFLTTWWLFHLPAVAGPIWVFCATGVLPVVHRTLSPDSVMKLSIGLAVVGFMLVFRREIIASMPAGKRPRPNNAQYGVQRSATTQIYPMPLAHPLASPRRHSPRSLMWLRLHAAGYILVGRNMARRVGNVASTYGRRLVRIMFVVVRRVYILAAVAAVFAWRAVEPYCRMFDRWLDKTIHRNKIAADVLDILDESWKTARILYRKFDGHGRTIGSRR